MKNIVEDFNDIDILIDIKDVDKVIKIMNEIGIKKDTQSHSNYLTQVFLEYEVDRVEIDIMAGFKIKTYDKIIDGSLKKEQIVEYIDFYDTNIPLQSIDLWLEYYTYMKRLDKVELMYIKIKEIKLWMNLIN